MTRSSERKQFEVRSARNAEFFRLDRPWAAIQISSRDNHPVLSEENLIGVLRLVFDDTSEPDTPQSFNPALATEILVFVEKMWDKAEAFLIHCEVGLSRSPAVAAALCRIYYDHDGRWFESIFPNRLVYRLLVEAHARRSANGK
ncbi:MAG: hypothetical protein ACLQNE_12035 [Thermoguttaceae bacterium]|jgi:predicted protein tyrosine phosphatase